MCDMLNASDFTLNKGMTMRYNRLLSILCLVAVACFAIQVFSDNKADVDIWGNVGFVTAWPSSPAFLRINTFSFTEPDRPWVNHEWLAQLVFHQVYETLGDPALLALKIALGLLVLGLCAASMKKEEVSGPIRFLLLLLVISVMGYGFSMRPHHFTYVLLSLFLFLLRLSERGKKWPYIVFPILAVVWANLHGAFFIGLLVLVVYGIGSIIDGFTSGENRNSKARGLLALFSAVGFLAASFLTPYGPRTWVFLGESAAKLRPYLSEWAPFHPLRDLSAHVDFVALVAIAGICMGLTKRRRTIRWTALFIVSLAAALFMRRNIPLFAITVALVASTHIESVAGQGLQDLLARVRPVVLAVVLTAFIGLSIFFGATFNKIDPLRLEIPPGRFPVRTVSFMKANRVQGNVLTFFDWAEYAIWHLFPDSHVFLDGRFRSAYSETVIDDYFAFLYAGEGWEKSLNDYPTDIVLVHTDNPVADLMVVRDDWALVLHTEIADLFLKRTVHADLIDRLATGNAQLPAQRPEYFFP